MTEIIGDAQREDAAKTLPQYRDDEEIAKLRAEYEEEQREANERRAAEAKLAEEAQAAAEEAVRQERGVLRAMPRESLQERHDAMLAHLAKVVLRPDGWVFLEVAAELIGAIDPSLMPEGWKPEIDLTGGGIVSHVEQDAD